MVSDPSSDDSYAERGAAFWLPPTGFGNGLPSVAWARIIDLPGRLVGRVLATLTRAGIPAYLDERRVRIADRAAEHPVEYRLWVDPHRYSAAEDVLMTLIRADRPSTAHGDPALRRPSPSRRDHRRPVG